MLGDGRSTAWTAVTVSSLHQVSAITSHNRCYRTKIAQNNKNLFWKKISVKSLVYSYSQHDQFKYKNYIRRRQGRNESPSLLPELTMLCRKVTFKQVCSTLLLTTQGRRTSGCHAPASFHKGTTELILFSQAFKLIYRVQKLKDKRYKSIQAVLTPEGGHEPRLKMSRATWLKTVVVVQSVVGFLQSEENNSNGAKNNISHAKFAFQGSSGRMWPT